MSNDPVLQALDAFIAGFGRPIDTQAGASCTLEPVPRGLTLGPIHTNEKTLHTSGLNTGIWMTLFRIIKFFFLMPRV